MDERARGPRGGRRPRTHRADLAALPSGAFIARDDAAWLVLDDALLRWSPAGYAQRAPRADARVRLLTPPSIVALFRNGYTPAIHPSAGHLT